MSGISAGHHTMSNLNNGMHAHSMPMQMQNSHIQAQLASSIGHPQMGNQFPYPDVKFEGQFEHFQQFMQ